MSTWARFRWASGHINAVLKPAIVLNVWSTLIFVVSFVPASGWVLRRLVARSGQSAVSDNDILDFVLSVPGLLFALLTLGFALAYWFVEQAAIMVIVLHAVRGAKVSVSRVLWDNIKRLPALLHMGVRQATLYLLAAIPFVGGIGLTYLLLLTEWDFYYYLNVQPPVWWIAVAIVGVIGAAYLVVAAWLYVRWVLSIPILLLERATPAEASRQSWSRTRGRFRELAVPLAAGWFIVLLSAAVTTWLIGVVAARLLGDSTTLAVLLPLVLGTFALLAIADLTWLIIGKIMHVMLMVDAYVGTTDLERSPVDPSAERPLPAGLIRTVWTVAGIVLLGVGVAAATSFLHRLSIERSLEITGHRGSKRRAPENTLSALSVAIAERADFAEIDVQTTADGVVVLLHDADLRRVASVSRRLNETNHEQLRDIDVGSWFDPKFSDERIPTLQEVIDLARGRIRLNIELKYTWADPDLARKVGEIVRQNDFVSQCVISSLNFEALTEIQQLFPELETGLIVFTAVGDVTRMDVDFVSISAAQARTALIKSAHRRDRAVHVWTVNDLSSVVSMIEMGVDNIITDEPEFVREVLGRWNELSTGEKLALMLRNLLVGVEPSESEP